MEDEFGQKSRVYRLTWRKSAYKYFVTMVQVSFAFYFSCENITSYWYVINFFLNL